MLVVLLREQLMDEVNWDNKSPNCRVCQKKFSFLNRKHHCRVCGLLHCADCVARLGVIEGQEEDPLDLCTSCCKKVETQRRSEHLQEKEKAKLQQMVLKAKQEGVESKKANVETVDDAMASQMQQKMRMRAQIQRHVSEDKTASPELVLEKLPSDWFDHLYRVDLIPETEWQKDDERAKCSQCDNEFTNTLRRHHCRACGFIYCTSCVPFVGIPIEGTQLGSTPDPVRTCKKCVQKAIALEKVAAKDKGQKMARLVAEKSATTPKTARSASPPK